ncbi:MAG: peptidase S1, partial [Actinobacteria bacterium]|nr:peptidase S1 [Actinomycetota bacterium]
MSQDEGRTPSDLDFTRPDGVAGGFAARPEPEPYLPPPPTVSPQEQAVFSRPAGADSFAPAPGERIAPRHAAPAPVPPGFAATFGASSDAEDGFAPAPGDRLPPSGPAPQSPWWKPDARRDPWRDPGAPFWLGRGAV